MTADLYQAVTQSRQGVLALCSTGHTALRPLAAVIAHAAAVMYWNSRLGPVNSRYAEQDLVSRCNIGRPGIARYLGTRKLLLVPATGVSTACGAGWMSSRRLPWGLVLSAPDPGCGARRPRVPVLGDAARVLVPAWLAGTSLPRGGSPSPTQGGACTRRGAWFPPFGRGRRGRVVRSVVGMNDGSRA